MPLNDSMTKLFRSETIKAGLKASATGALLALLAACGAGDGEVTEGVYPVSDSNVVGTVTGETGVYQDIVYGDPNAPVTLLEYGSLTCGACAAFANSVYPDIERDYVDTGKVKFVFRNYLLNGLDLQASNVMRCGTEETSRAMIKQMFASQRQWLGSQDQIGELAKLARRAGMSRVKFDRCASDKDMSEFLTKMTDEGRARMGVKGTPTLYVNGQRLTSYGPDVVRKALDAAL